MESKKKRSVAFKIIIIIKWRDSEMNGHKEDGKSHEIISMYSHLSMTNHPMIYVRMSHFVCYFQLLFNLFRIFFFFFFGFSVLCGAYILIRLNRMIEIGSKGNNFFVWKEESNKRKSEKIDIKWSSEIKTVCALKMRVHRRRSKGKFYLCHPRSKC